MDKKLLTFFVAVVVSITLNLILITVLLGAVQQRGDKINPTKNAQPGERGTEPSLVVLPPDPSPYRGEEIRKYNADYLEIQRNINSSTQQLVRIGWIVGFGELLLLLFQALYTGKAAFTADRSLKLTQRAHMSSGKWSFSVPLKAGSFPAFLCTWENQGNTLASDIDTAFEIKVAPPDLLPEQPQFPHGKAKDTFSTLAPHSSIIKEWIADDALAQVDLDRINNPADPTVLCFWGFVTYRDVFQTAHTTAFGLSYKPGHGPAGGFAFLTKTKYNYAD